MDEVEILTPALDLSSCRKGRKEGGKEEMGASVERIRALAQPHRCSLLWEALREELDHHVHLVNRLGFLREGLGWTVERHPYLALGLGGWTETLD